MRDTVYLFRFLFPRKLNGSSRLQLSLLQNFRGLDEVQLPKYSYELNLSTPRSARSDNYNRNYKSSSKKGPTESMGNNNENSSKHAN